jgi:hypothetical protein
MLHLQTYLGRHCAVKGNELLGPFVEENLAKRWERRARHRRAKADEFADGGCAVEGIVRLRSG